MPLDVLQFAEEPNRLSAQGLWRALDDDERELALKAHIAKPKHRRKITMIVAEKRKFRPQTVHRFADKKLIKMARHVSFPVGVCLVLLKVLHMRWRDELLIQFLDNLKVDHKDGFFDSWSAKPSSEIQKSESEVHAAADQLKERHDLRRIVIYFLTLALCDVPFSEHLWSWMARQTKDREAVEDTSLSEDQDDDSTEEDATVQERTPSDDENEDPDLRYFTTLDKLLLTAINDAKGNVTGSLGKDEIDDAIDEVVRLNATRARSYYPMGYRDVKFARETSDVAEDLNDRQARWYWAGKIVAWGEFSSWSDILQAYEQGDVARLGDGADQASDKAAPVVVEALWQKGRVTEIAKFVKAPALRQKELFRKVLEHGTDFLWNQDDPEAVLPVFNRLMEAVEQMEKEGYASATQRFLEVRRRRAHCLQWSDEHGKARRILEGLLKIDSSARNRAMVFADLGMLDGSFNRLSDITLPKLKNELPDFIERLELGFDNFQKSVKCDARYSSHGHYCLGVLALAQALQGSKDVDLDRTENHLSQAKNRFATDPDNYGILVDRTKLYLGVVRILRLTDSGKLSHATKLVIGALKKDVELPPYVMIAIVQSLSLTTTEDLKSLANSLLELKRGSKSALDALQKSDSVLEHCPNVTRALRKRAEQEGLTQQAARDLRRCVHGFLKSGDKDEACEVLDKLELLALEGIGQAEFEELLDKVCDRGAWSPEEADFARALCLEAQGKKKDAAGVLFQWITPYVNRYKFGDAFDLLDKIDRLGVMSEDRIKKTHEYILRSEQRKVDDPSIELAGIGVVHVVFVGNRDEHAKLKPRIQKALNEQTPDIRPTFIYAEWNSSWSLPFEKVRDNLNKFHDERTIVVIHRHTRTQLGEEIRNECRKRGIPWHTCRGDQTGITNAIIKAAAAVPDAGLDKPE